jgi:hypothetical protein
LRSESIGCSYTWWFIEANPISRLSITSFSTYFNIPHLAGVLICQLYLDFTIIIITHTLLNLHIATCYIDLMSNAHGYLIVILIRVNLPCILNVVHQTHTT